MDSRLISPIIISIKVAIPSIILTFFVGVLMAYMVYKLKSRWLQSLLDGIFNLPLVLPPTVAGFFLLEIFGVKGIIGKFFLEFFGIKIAFSFWACVLAAVIIAFPLMYRSSLAAFRQMDKNIIFAAKTLGLSERKIFFKIVLPTCKHGIMTGGILSFTRGLGEFGATTMIAGNIINKTRTISLAIYSEVIGGNMARASFYVWILVIIAILAILLMNKVEN
ncbi:MAG: molybdate ABC transporter permease subunit [Erysipelotrichaceae bacterium]|nr:molybdate ABC transporter permease subunit [Erysipelotrichaceae bacterium]MDY5251157.1 molybdate ABC transporter permease subunit [Erysipelotrichaceae bacterium]